MKVLFVGLGGAGQRHLRNLLHLVPEAEVAAIRHSGRSFEIANDLKADSSTNIIDKYGISEFRSFEEARSFAPDFAVVANPTSRHYETCLALVERGIPVFMEKPIGTERDDVAKLAQQAERHETPVMIAYQLRFHPCVRKAKEWLDQGRVGVVQTVAAHVHSYMPGWHDYESYTDFYAGRKDLGGGVVLTEIHELDLLTWFFGLPDRLCAMGGKVSALDIDVEDTVGIVMDQPYQGRNFPLTVTLSFVQRPPDRHLGIHGERGSMLLSIPKDTLLFVDHETGTTDRFDLTEFDRNQMFVSELAHFIDCLKMGVEPETSLRNVLPGHRVATAIKASLSSGGVEKLSG